MLLATESYITRVFAYDGCWICDSETVLAEMGVALREDSTLVGVFSPRKVKFSDSPILELQFSMCILMCIMLLP